MQDLPIGWILVDMPECVYFQEGPGLRKWQFAEDGIPFLNIRTFVEGKIDKTKCKFVSLKEFQNKYEHFLLNDGDIVVSSSGTIGKIAVIQNKDLPLMLNTSTIRFRSRYEDNLLQTYLKYYLQSPHFLEQIHASKTGSAIFNYGPSHLKKMVLLVPPLNEQHRIVAKLEKLLAKVNACGDRLDKIPTILKRFRQSVLAAACSGRLTAEWREQNPDVESAEELLKRTQDQRAAKATTTAQQKKIDEIYSYKESQDSDELPSSWSYCCLEKIAYSFNYGTSTKSSPSGDIPVLRMGNLQEGVIDWSDLVFTSDTAEISKYSLEPYTVLFNRTNSPELVGKTSIYLGERPAIFAGYLIRIIHVKECLNPKYLNYFLNSLQVKEYCRQVKTDGVSQSNINAQKLGKFEIPFCSLQEQEEIVRRVEALFQKCDQIEARYQKAKAYTDKLTQAILAKAFRGELVPQDPNDEPAEVLLERIKAEKAAAQPQKKPRQPRSKKAKAE